MKKENESFQSTSKRQRGALDVTGCALGLAMLLILPAAVQAQYGDSMAIPWNNPVSATLSTNVWNNYIIYQAQQKKAKGGAAAVPAGEPAKSSSSPAAPPRARANESSLRFHPTGTHLLTGKLADQLGKTQAQKDQVTVIVNMLFQEFDKQAVKLGKPNDLAFALSYFLAQNATVYRGTTDPKDEQFLELRETIVAALAQSGGFRNLTDRQKQELYETLVSYTGLVYLGYQDARKRGAREEVETYRQLAGLNLKNITHIEPERSDFTAEGLTIQPQ